MTAHAVLTPATTAWTPWRRHLAALAAVCAGLLILFARDAIDMATIWWTSSTYNHCLLIAPIIGWLVWQRLPDLRPLVPGVWPPGLLLVAAGAGGWLLGEAGGVGLARHAGLVLMGQGAVVACLGKIVSRALAFPIFYAIFLIPAGDEIVPLMQGVTADLCMILLGWAGIPAHLEGIFITIPGALFRVAEACAGVKFLVAMVALGALVANVCLRSWPRRIAFMAASIVIPILANGVRAWGTIMVAHHVDPAFGTSFDHVIYGGVFFALVIALLIGAGWPFFDRGPNDRWFDPAALQPTAPTPTLPDRLVRIAAAALAIAALPLLWSAAIAAGTHEIPDITMPDVQGWTRIAHDGAWSPHFAGADRLRIARYRSAAGVQVDLAIAAYARQGEGRELVGFGQGAIGPDSDWNWVAAQPAIGAARVDRIISYGRTRDVATVYRVGDIVTGSNRRVMIETMKTRLLGGPQHAVAILVAADDRPALEAFVAALEPIAPLADRAAGAEG